MIRFFSVLLVGLLAAVSLGAVPLPEENPGEPFEAILAKLDELAGRLDDLAGAVAAADDGVVKISQECVADGCFPGDTPGFPVQITEPGSYRLASNLLVATPNTTGVRIAADGVSFDLGGFGIAGTFGCDTSGGFPFTCDPNGTGFGVQAVGPAGNTFLDGIAIRNGTIAGFDLAAVFVNGVGRIEDLAVYRSHRGLVVSVGTVQRVTVTGIERDGITMTQGEVANVVVFQVGTRAIGAAVVRDSVVHATGETGVLADAAYSNSVGRTGQAVPSPGMSCRLCIENKVRDAVGPGIAFVGTSQGNFLGNHIVASTGLGIEANFFSVVAYGHNVLVGNNGGGANPQVGGAATATFIEIAPNVCGTDTVCP